MFYVLKNTNKTLMKQIHSTWNWRKKNENRKEQKQMKKERNKQ